MTARHSVADEQSRRPMRGAAQGADEGSDTSLIAMVGDSVGGNMTFALSLMAKEHGDVSFVQQVLFQPVAHTAFATASYREFTEGYFLTPGYVMFRVRHTTGTGYRAQIAMSPSRADFEQ